MGAYSSRPDITSAGALEVAWAAGLFEGEGTVYYASDLNQVVVAVRMTDEDIVRRWADVVGVSVQGPRQPSGPSYWKPYWEARVKSRRRVSAVYGAFEPWLGERRLEQFQAALNKVKDRSGRGKKLA